VSAGVAIERVSARYGAERALQDVSLAVGPGEWVRLLGWNGSGKTTLLRAISRLIEHSGVVRLGDSTTAHLSRLDLARRIAMVPQYPVLPAGMTVADYILLGRTAHRRALGRSRAQDFVVANATIARLDLAGFEGRRLGTLSGGEAQRVVLARALVQEPSVLLLDEPTSALDIGQQQTALELVDEMRRERSITVIAAMHDLTLARPVRRPGRADLPRQARGMRHTPRGAHTGPHRRALRRDGHGRGEPRQAHGGGAVPLGSWRSSRARRVARAMNALDRRGWCGRAFVLADGRVGLGVTRPRARLRGHRGGGRPRRDQPPRRPRCSLSRGHGDRRPRTPRRNSRVRSRRLQPPSTHHPNGVTMHPNWFSTACPQPSEAHAAEAHARQTVLTKPVGALGRVEPPLGANLMAAVIRVGRAIGASLKPEGMNLITSAGKVAEQSVFHLHLHVVPRWQRDGFGQIWPVEGKFEDADLEDVADRIREACDMAASGGAPAA
jgi:iron complex transport system ATP-binding protein